MTEVCSGLDLLLMVYADGEASPDEAARVETHVQHCERCRRRLAEWQGLSRETDTLVTAVTAKDAPATANSRPGEPAREPAATAGTRRSAAPAAAAHRAPSRMPVGPASSPHTGLVVALILSLVAVVLLPTFVRRESDQAARAPAGHAPVAVARIANRPTTVVAATPPPLVAAPAATPVPPVPMAMPAIGPTPASAMVAVPLSGQVALVLNGNIHLVSALGNRQLPVPANATAPRWSPSGHWLLYETTAPAADPGLWLVQPGTDAPPWRLPAPADVGLARWSPRRDEIAVAGGDGALWLVQAGSDRPRQLLSAGGVISNLTWSPDGAAVAVERRRSGTASQSILAVTLGGSIQTVATGAVGPEAGAAGQPAGSAGAIPVLGSWAPHNAGISYWLDSAVNKDASGAAPLRLWSPAQGDQALLPSVLMYRDFVSWAPDGHAVAAVASVLSPDSAERVGQITVVPVTPRAAPLALSDANRADGDVAWSPDGTLLAYASSVLAPTANTGAGGRQIWVEAPDGSGRRPVSPGTADSFPQWSKDGKELLYVHQAGGVAQLWLVERDGTRPHPVADGMVGLAQVPNQAFGHSGLVSYRGIFDWSDGTGGD
jgi:Tol biopolymer transport system component